jgi:Tol biopolymer transport system component
LADASVERVIASELQTGMPAWAMRQEKFAYVIGRNGPPEIWVRGEGWDRPIVTASAFPDGTTNWFMTPALSPGGDRVIYTRVESGQAVFNWISSLSGGPPVRLTNATAGVEYGGSWSPDGSRFVYLQVRNGEDSLMIVKTSGDAAPTLLRAKVGAQLPEWSPDGQWIAFRGGPGLGSSIISPDGQTVRSYGELGAYQLTFSRDSSRLYGIRGDHQHRYLFSMDLATKEMKNIGDVGKDYTPRSDLNPGIRLSLSPDGKRILYPAITSNTSLWMLEGFDSPGWWGRLRGTLF